MKPEQLINHIRAENNHLVALYAQGASGQTEVGEKLDGIGLSGQQREQVVSLIRSVVEESTYHLICLLEGMETEEHNMVRILDDQGNLLSGKLDELFFEEVLR